MPEYLAPGVYVEEVSFRSKSIEGVSTTTTGFIGATRYGPVDLAPDVITSLVEYERTYGDRQPLQFGSDTLHNYMWHAVRAFFENGGKRLYIARTFEKGADDGIARATITNGGAAMTLSARFPGAAGNLRVRITLTLGQNVLAQNPGATTPVLRGVLENDIVLVTRMVGASPPSSPLSQPAGTFARVTVDRTTSPPTWHFVTSAPATIDLSSLHANADPALSDRVQVVTSAFTIIPVDPGQPSLVYAGLALDRTHQRAGSPDSIWARFRSDPPSLAAARTMPIVVAVTPGASDTGLGILDLLAPAGSALLTKLLTANTADAERSLEVALTGGNDGLRPTADAYEGTGGAPTDRTKTGLVAFEDIDEISIVAAPGSSFGYENGYRANASTIFNHLITHCTSMRYRIAVLDAGDKQSIAEVRALRGKLDSTYAALYYPWVTILDPVTQQEINVPPSGAVCGIYARNDINRGVYKAPANEVVETAIGLETILNKAQQDILNPLGVNCFRSFEGRGFRLWGARTISSDPEWKYVNLRRYFAYLEHSIDKGTQWAVFEPNGDRLWANIRITISDFLFNEWVNGALLGDRAEKAYFVKCDRSTMTQNDLDNGRLVCLVGVAALRPAEYVIIRIGQWTADHKV
jgi:phage tail sheath protein FI